MDKLAHRGTIFVEEAKILSHQSYDGDQYILRLGAPRAAARATPGSFAHLSCGIPRQLRRPLSIMRADPQRGWLELLYKPVGPGLAEVAKQSAGATINVIAPIGNAFRPDPTRPRVLAIGGGVGIPPMLFLADRLRADSRFSPIVLMGSEVPFPFELTAAKIEIPGVAKCGANASLKILEEWGVPSRLASNADLAGCYEGYVPDLAALVLAALPSDELASVHVCACGPEPMLAAVAELSRRFAVRCDLALEEFMACGVGGCAGCTVLVKTDSGTAMKRVCVDGPVFSAAQIYG